MTDMEGERILTTQSKGYFWMQMEHVVSDRGDWRSFVCGVQNEVDRLQIRSDQF